MEEVFDIRAKIEQQKMQAQKEKEQKQKETKQELIEYFRHKENTRLAKIAIALAVIAIIISIISFFL